MEKLREAQGLADPSRCSCLRKRLNDQLIYNKRRPHIVATQGAIPEAIPADDFALMALTSFFAPGSALPM